MKHTPGPWKAISNKEGRGWYISALAGISLALVREQRIVEEEQANAHLIAAAPEMLEALKSIYKLQKDNNREESLSCRIAKEVIAKTEGL